MVVAILVVVVTVLIIVLVVLEVVTSVGLYGKLYWFNQVDSVMWQYPLLCCSSSNINSSSSNYSSSSRTTDNISSSTLLGSGSNDYHLLDWEIMVDFNYQSTSSFFN